MLLLSAVGAGPAPCALAGRTNARPGASLLAAFAASSVTIPHALGLGLLAFRSSAALVPGAPPADTVYRSSVGSTTVDFAYAVHTEVGHRCVGARVNGKLVPLESRLNNGDVVEITRDRMRADIGVEFYVRVKPDATSIALAAQTNMTPVGLLGCGARELHVRPTLSRKYCCAFSVSSSAFSPRIAGRPPLRHS